MKTYAIVKTHEIALKGKNRPWFMRRLADNLRRSTRGTGVSDVWLGQMLVGLTLRDDADWDLVESRIKDCFGVAKFFRAHRLPKDLDRVKEALAGLLESHEFHSFRITANRADKRFHVTSDDINRDLGAFVKEFSGARVDLTNPDLTIFIDVLPKEILLYFHEIRASGGLPVGVSGSVMAMLSGGIDSPVAAWQMMKRGCQAHLVHFHSYPLVDNSSMEKAAELAQFLTRYQFQSSLSLVPLAEIQKQIIVSTPPAYRIILYRRFMVRIAEILSGQVGAKAMVTGESCGQVSSQTLENISVVNQVAGMPILRPLIGMNKEEIMDQARTLGTYPISIQPDQDCCSLFVPKHPVTRGDLKTVLHLESLLPVEELVQQALDQTRTQRFERPEPLQPAVAAAAPVAPAG